MNAITPPHLSRRTVRGPQPDVGEDLARPSTACPYLQRGHLAGPDTNRAVEHGSVLMPVKQRLAHQVVHDCPEEPIGANALMVMHG
jgi:hypothetical protein